MKTTPRNITRWASKIGLVSSLITVLVFGTSCSTTKLTDYKPKSDLDNVACMQKRPPLELDNNVKLEVFTMSKREMSACQFAEGKIIVPKLGCAYKYEKGLKVLLRMPTTDLYLVVGSGENIIAVKACKDLPFDSSSPTSGVANLKPGLFKYIGETEINDLKGEPNKIYCFEVVNIQADKKILPLAEVGRCVSLVRTALYEAWEQPGATETGSRPAKLLIRFDPGGRIVSYRIIQSSGSTLFDTTVLKAAANCPPIRGLTRDFLQEHDELAIEFKLE